MRVSAISAIFPALPRPRSGIIRIVSKVKDLEQRLEKDEHQLRLYQRISRHLTKQTDFRQSLRIIAGWVGEFLQPDSCLVYLLAQGELVLCAAAGPNPAAVGEVRLRLDEGLTGWVARERRMLAISREAYHDPRFKFFRDLPEDTFEAFLSAPIIARNRVVGVINVQHRQPHAHTGDEMEMLATVGEMIGCLVTMASVDLEKFDEANFADLILPAAAGLGPVG